jgi:hypothetical protein
VHHHCCLTRNSGNVWESRRRKSRNGDHQESTSTNAGCQTTSIVVLHLYKIIIWLIISILYIIFIIHDLLLVLSHGKDNAIINNNSTICALLSQGITIHYYPITIRWGWIISHHMVDCHV